MTVNIIELKDIVIGIAALITALKVIWDIAKKPGTKIKILEEKDKDFEERITNLEKNNDKLELVLEKVNNLTTLMSNQNNSLTASLEERELLIKSNKVLIKAVSALLEESNVDHKIKTELNVAESSLDDFIIKESHKTPEEIRKNIKY